MVEYNIETFRGAGNQPYRWRLKHVNGEIIAQSEGYANKGDRDQVVENLHRALNEGTGAGLTEADS